jgi:hypothetical protein
MKKITIQQRSTLKGLRPRLGQVVALVELLGAQLSHACDCRLQPGTCWCCSVMQEFLELSDCLDHASSLLEHVLELADLHTAELAASEAHVVKTNPPADFRQTP